MVKFNLKLGFFFSLSVANYVLFIHTSEFWFYHFNLFLNYYTYNIEWNPKNVYFVYELYITMHFKSK